jgi:RNA polymerase sigma-70 factor (ECF subfamily)
MSFNPLKKLFKPNLVTYNDEELMQLLVKKQNHEAFEILYLRYKSPVFNYLCSQISKAQAEDLLQDIFIKFVSKASDYRGEAKVKTWIWTIARNSLIDFFRSSQHKFEMQALAINGITQDDEPIFDLPSDDLSAEEQLIEKTDLKQIEHCLNELTKEQKEIVLLHTHSELSYKEISAQTQLSIGAVKSVLFRSKAKLAECFKRGGHL